MKEVHESYIPHVLLFPFPASGHIKPLLCLAQILCNAGLKVTFLNTHHYHRRFQTLRRISAVQFPSLRFQSISDGLPPDEPRNVLDRKFRNSVNEAIPPLFRDLLLSYYNNKDGSGFAGRPPVSCVITDVIMRFPMDVAEEFGVPVFSFSTFSARFLFILFSIPNLLRDGQLPHPDGNTDQVIHGIPGGEGLIRCKDIPGKWSVGEMLKNDSISFVNMTVASARTSGLIINTFDELEAPFLKSLSKIYNKIYTVGPIHSLIKNSPNEISKQDHNCLAWLDSQSPKSVVFVSFGTLVKMTSLQLIEFWNGLINSKVPFLLVLRSDVNNDDEKEVVREILETESNGKWSVVSWAPQEEVLAHEAIGGFLTHSGWNSTLESIAAGVPMISWPQFGDQLSNCTWVNKVWKIGYEMEDQYDRYTIETMVRSITGKKNEEMRNRVVELAKKVKEIVSKDGVLNQNLKTLAEDIKKIKLN